MFLLLTLNMHLPAGMLKQYRNLRLGKRKVSATHSTDSGNDL